MRVRLVAGPLVALAIACVSHQGEAPSDGGLDSGVDSSDSSPDGNVCGLGFLGDPSNDIELHVTARAPDGTSSEIQDGSTVTLTFPPQGGRVLFIGVRANNINPCAVQLSGALRDLTSKEVRLDSRTVNLIKASDGFGTSADNDISTFANVAVCANEWSAVDLYGQPYDLIVSVTDFTGRMASKTVRVTPQCAEPGRVAECMCICKAGYVLGQACESGDAATEPVDAADGGSE